MIDKKEIERHLRSIDPAVAAFAIRAVVWMLPELSSKKIKLRFIFC